MAFWKKKEPAEPMISKAEHDRIVAANDRIALTGRQSLHVLIKQKDEEIGYFQVENARLLAELATLKAERDILDEACNKAAIELAHWKKHGQLRDPATGRLIPKAKPSDVFTASHSPA